MKFYHGGLTPIYEPNEGYAAPSSDFGPGFYIAKYKEQAEKRALYKYNKDKDKYPDVNPIVSVYSLDMDKIKNDFKYKYFENPSKEWAKFIILCRRLYEHDYDVVDGPMADSNIVFLVKDIILDEIDDAIVKEMIFKWPNHQLMLRHDALSCLKFEYSYNVLTGV